MTASGHHGPAVAVGPAHSNRVPAPGPTDPLLMANWPQLGAAQPQEQPAIGERLPERAPQRRLLFLLLEIIPAIIVIAVIFGGTQALFLGGVLGLFAEQGFAVFLRNLVIIRVDFAESEEAVAIAAIIDERRLERGFDPGYLG